MRFLMLVCVADMLEIPDDTDIDANPWVEETTPAGQRVMGDRTAMGADVRVVRVRDGRTLMTDGPFAPATDYIAGFDILECASLDEAVGVAARHPIARFGALELRPFWTEPDAGVGGDPV